MKCKTCSGTGRIADNTCPACKGAGVIGHILTNDDVDWATRREDDRRREDDER